MVEIIKFNEFDMKKTNEKLHVLNSIENQIDLDFSLNCPTEIEYWFDELCDYVKTIINDITLEYDLLLKFKKDLNNLTFSIIEQETELEITSKIEKIKGKDVLVSYFSTDESSVMHYPNKNLEYFRNFILKEFEENLY